MTEELRAIRAEGAHVSMHVLLRVGQFRAPITFGSRGDFVTAGASDCLPVHAKAYFDGSTLFVASIDAASPALANGVAIGTGWAPVACPAVLEFGFCRLAYERIAGERDRAGVPGADAAVEPLTQVWSRGALSSVLERERSEFAKRTALQGECAPSRLSSRSGLEVGTFVGGPPLSASEFEATPAAGSASPRREDRSPRKAGIGGACAPRSGARERLVWMAGQARGRYARLSRGTRRALLLLPVIALAAFVLMAPEPQTAPAKRPRGSVPAAPPPPAPSAARSAAQTGSVGQTDPAPSLSLSSSAALAKPEAPNRGRTAEADAVDAAARGAYSEAAALYDRLAEQHPQKPVFASAARILRERHGANSP